jgi:hypothetical protein
MARRKTNGRFGRDEKDNPYARRNRAPVSSELVAECHRAEAKRPAATFTGRQLGSESAHAFENHVK